ncbi:hypothetical protein chiPu_0004876 [Chiloscyllium punctatum]|uniref:Uncharacterized protein n=1 Tax=Chiloscyllium punctatum TaxID=137246 RepID=A0A401S7U0_CHIPU|nr:hypothetical protein [Chiloscyllium punctatum]
MQSRCAFLGSHEFLASGSYSLPLTASLLTSKLLVLNSALTLLRYDNVKQTFPLPDCELLPRIRALEWKSVNSRPE